MLPSCKVLCSCPRALYRSLSTNAKIAQEIDELTKKLGKLQSQLAWDKCESLPFAITPNEGHVKYTWSKRRGWDNGQFVKEPFVNLHIHAGVLHYGMSLFEGSMSINHGMSVNLAYLWQVLKHSTVKMAAIE